MPEVHTLFTQVEKLIQLLYSSKSKKGHALNCIQSIKVKLSRTKTNTAALNSRTHFSMEIRNLSYLYRNPVQAIRKVCKTEAFAEKLRSSFISIAIKCIAQTDKPVSLVSFNRGSFQAHL